MHVRKLYLKIIENAMEHLGLQVSLVCQTISMSGATSCQWEQGNYKRATRRDPSSRNLHMQKIHDMHIGTLCNGSRDINQRWKIEY